MNDAIVERAIADRRAAIDRAQRADRLLDMLAMEARRGTRPVLIGEGVFEQFAARTDDGRKVTVDWGQPDEFGFFTPTFKAES